MRVIDAVRNIMDARKKEKARGFSQELANQFFLSPLCSDYENVFAQVRPLIDAMKSVMPYGVTERGAKLDYNKTPELYWLKNPNDDMGWSEFADLMFATWLTEDELDIHLWRNDRGAVIGYTILPPQSRIYLGYGRWEWQVMTVDGMETLDESQVMRLRFSRSPRDVQRGVSPASSVRIWAQIDDLLAQYEKAYFENGAVPATITFITASTEELYNKTRHELENNLKGARNRNKTVFAWRQFDNDTGTSTDQIEVKTIQGNNSTLAIREIVDIVNDRLNKSIGVSNFILGDDSSAKYDNAELSNHQFTSRRVYPALVAFWNQFQHELERILGGGLGYGISFDLEIPELTEREKAKAEINRIKSETLISLISAGSSSAAAVEALGLSDKWKSAADGIYQSALDNKLNAPYEIEYSKPKAISATVDAKKDEKEPQEAETVKKCDHKHCTCSHSLDKLPPMTRAERETYNLLLKLGQNIVKDGIEGVDLDEVIAKMTETLEKSANSGAIKSAKAVQLLAKKDIANEIKKSLSDGSVYISEALSKKISNRADLLVKGYADYTQEEMKKVLAEDLSAEELKERLAKVVSSDRAEIIARNETNYAARTGRLEQDQELAEQYGLTMKLVWRTSGDADVCDVCAAMEGTEVELGKAFPDSVKTADGEIVSWEHSSWNDGGQIPDAHVNCRCYFDEVIE